MISNESYSDAVTDFILDSKLPRSFVEVPRARAAGADLDAPLERLLSPGRIFVDRNGFSYHRIRSFDGRDIEIEEIQYGSNEAVNIDVTSPVRLDCFLDSFLSTFYGWYEGRWPPLPLHGKQVWRRTPMPGRWPAPHQKDVLDAALIAELDLGY